MSPLTSNNRQYRLELSNIPSKRGRSKKYVFELQVSGMQARMKTKAIMKVLQSLFGAQVESHRYDSNKLIMRSDRVVKPTEGHLELVRDCIYGEIDLVVGRVIEFVDTNDRSPTRSEINWLIKQLPSGNELSRVPQHIALRSESTSDISPTKQRDHRHRRREQLTVANTKKQAAANHSRFQDLFVSADLFTGVTPFPH